MQLPHNVQTFFRWEQPADSEAIVAAFTDDAVVRDEGKSREGLAAIRQWWTAAQQQYQYTVEPFDMTRAGESISVRAVVSGNFPGSPVTLTDEFILRDGKIALLEIA